MTAQESYRLPRHAWPRRYELRLEPDLPAASFDGQVAIDLDLVEAAETLTLNATELDLSSATLTAPDGTTFTGQVSANEAEQQVTLSFGEILAPGSGYKLSIAFRGTLNDKLHGFYRSRFTDASGVEHVIATTQFEAADARRAFPCWDEPEFKATFAVTLIVAEGLTGVSNGALENSRRMDDGRVELRFAETMVMSTYLVAFIVGPFSSTDPVDVDGVAVRIAAVPDKLALTSYAEEVAEHSLRFLAGYFGIRYPAGKLDHVAIPDFAFGAMENLGCVTYRESALLADPSTAAQADLQRIATVVAHETAHMWFGDLVTMKWWNGIWLNEAFATFMELTTTNDFRPDWDVWTSFGASRAAAMEVDGLVATRPVEFAVGRPEEADGMFDVLTYEKGGSVLRMLEQYVGPAVFRRGISHYLATHAYANTETSDLWDAIEEVSGQPVRVIMDSWIFQGGYPEISAELSGDGATVVVRQRRFLYASDGRDDRVWAAPINLRASIAGTVHRERLLLDGKSASHTFPGPVDWVVVNDGGWGFYRTRYSPDLRGRLTKEGATVLSPLELQHLVGDTWAAVVAGTAELPEWIETAHQVAGGTDPDLWGAIVGVLGALNAIGDDDDVAALAGLAIELSAGAWAELGWDPDPGESDRTAMARSRVLSAQTLIGCNPGLAGEAADRLRRFQAGEAAALSPDLLGVAASASVATGGTPAWEATVEAYRSADTVQLKLRYLYALTETPDPGLRARTLDFILGPEVRSQDAPLAIRTFMSRRGATSGVWRRIRDDWDSISTRFPASLLTRTLDGCANLTEAADAAEVHAFFASTDIPISPTRVAQIQEQMDINVALAARLRGRIAGAIHTGGQAPDQA